MNIKRGLLASLAIYVFTILWSGFYHLILLKGSELEIKHLYRPDISEKMWLSLLGALGISILFVIGYSLCARKGTIVEGIIYGVCFSILAGLLVDLNQYVLYPIPASLVIKWYIGGLVEFAIDGLLVSIIYPVKRS